MRQLPNDICRCIGDGCDIRESCHRYRQIELDQKLAETGIAGWISLQVTMRTDGEDCDSFIKVED
jgi:hypothetical protein